MNYLLHYNRLIEKAQNHPIPEGYTERHHIVPRALGGGNEKANLVVLTAREHYVSHLLLARIHGGKMWAAVHLMASQNGRYYEWIRRQYAESLRGEGNPFFGKKHSDESKIRMTRLGYRHSDETKRGFSESRKGPANGMWGKTQSKETREKIGAKNRGRPRNPEVSKKHSETMKGSGNPRFGIKVSEETKAKIKQAKAEAKIRRLANEAASD